MTAVHFSMLIACAATALGCVPEGYAIGACKTNALWFENKALDAECGKGVEDETESASVSFSAMHRCISVPESLHAGSAYVIHFDFASDALTCFHGPLLSVSGTNRETGKKETAFSRKFSCSAEGEGDELRFVNEGGDLERPKVTLTSGDWCASIRFTSIKEGPAEE